MGCLKYEITKSCEKIISSGTSASNLSHILIFRVVKEKGRVKAKASLQRRTAAARMSNRKKRRSLSRSWHVLIYLLGAEVGQRNMTYFLAFCPVWFLCDSCSTHQASELTIHYSITWQRDMCLKNVMFYHNKTMHCHKAICVNLIKPPTKMESVFEQVENKQNCSLRAGIKFSCFWRIPTLLFSAHFGDL